MIDISFYLNMNLDLINVRKTICENTIKKYFEKLQKYVNLYDNITCDYVDFEKINDTNVRFSCVFVGRYNTVNFEYGNTCMCEIINEDDNLHVIIGESIDEFCVDVIKCLYN